MNSEADRYFQSKLEERKASGLYRTWGPERDFSKTDFYSNDYLGLAQSQTTKNRLIEHLQNQSFIPNGSSGSRLVSGQSQLLEELESMCCSFFKGESAIFLPNGYLANLALLSCIATRHDTIIYDEQSHVSLKDGIRLSLAQKFSFKHNDVEDLKSKLKKAKGKIFIVVEAIYSMDGDLCPIQELVEVSNSFGAHLIVDEAHSTGVLASKGQGLCIDQGLESQVWARIYTFGKALGAAGAVLILSETTKQYLINASHPVIYSTAALPLQVLMAKVQLEVMLSDSTLIQKLQNNIAYWCGKINQYASDWLSSNSSSPVQLIRIPGNGPAIQLAQKLNSIDFQVKAMLSPTIKPGLERLRISLHSYNTPSEIDLLVEECWERRK